MNNDIIVATFASKKKSGWSMEPDTGVKIYHNPTGKEFSCEIYKSVHRNKAHCIECLEKFLADGVSMKNTDYSKYDCPYSHIKKDCGHELKGPEGYENTYGVWCQCGFRGPVFVNDPKELGLGGSIISNETQLTNKPVKVKPLVWSDNGYAHTPFGIIRAAKQPFKSPDRYDVDSDFGIDLYGFNSLEAAKQTAQEQYEKLILGSIE